MPAASMLLTPSWTGCALVVVALVPWLAVCQSHDSHGVRNHDPAGKSVEHFVQAADGEISKADPPPYSPSDWYVTVPARQRSGRPS